METKDKKLTTKTTWDEKYLRETPFMPFGSMMNAFGQVNRGAGMDLTKFEEASKVIFQLAKGFIIEAYQMVEKSEDKVDIPIKTKKDEGK